MKLLLNPNPLLRAQSVPVERVGWTEQRRLRRMLRHMRRWNGIGLAAPQVGSLEQLIVAEVGSERVLWANPTILEGGLTERMSEGCLSLPGVVVDVGRPSNVWVRALDMQNREAERKLKGLIARVVQHEVDHLYGVLITDHGQAKPYDALPVE
jgi:peptide deformylase